MERYPRDYDRSRNDRDYRDRDYDRDQHRNEHGQFENYRDRYSNRGNYYGMPNSGYEYRNVSGSQSRDYNKYNSGRDSDYGSSRGDYHYGDQNKYMRHDRNEPHMRRDDWRSERDSGSSRDNYSNYGNRNENPYRRQDNSYQYSGSGRRYSDFGRDEDRTYTKNSYNPGSVDSYHDRSEFKRKREENDFGRDQDRSNPVYDGSYDDSDFRYHGSIVNSSSKDRDDNYATGMYASNRSYVSDNREGDGERMSSRERRHPRSGPNYDANSGISSYGYDNFGI